jgi:hypothetical protein
MDVQVSTIHAHDLPAIPSPTTLWIPKAALAHILSASSYSHNPSIGT